MDIVFHSVLNRTGAARYLREEILRGREGLLVTWTAENDVPEGWHNVALSHGPRGRGKVAGMLWRIWVWSKQVVFVFTRCRSADTVHVNSIANVGAIAAIAMRQRSLNVVLYAHESPVGKWLFVYRLIRSIYRGRVITVSPYMQAELSAIGIRSTWRYPRAFSTITPLHGALPLSDVVMVAHPDESKGFGLVSQFLQELPQAISVRLYLSRQPDKDVRFSPNVTVIIGKPLESEDYNARICVLATNPVSTRETFSYITAESLSAGVPVVCAPSGGVSEQLIHLVNGYFVPEYSSRAFVDAVQLVLTDVALCAALSKGARMCNALKVLPGDAA